MRCYDGAPDSELKAHLQRQAEAEQELKATIPGSSCTCFPAEAMWMVFVDYKPFTNFFVSKEYACRAAIRKFNGVQ